MLFCRVRLRVVPPTVFEPSTTKWSVLTPLLIELKSATPMIRSPLSPAAPRSDGRA